METIFDKINSRLLRLKNSIKKDELFIKENPKHDNVSMLQIDIERSNVAINQLEWVLEELCK